MTTSTELRPIVGAMTARPWKWSAQHRLEGLPYTEDYGSGPEVVRDTIIETDCGHYPPFESDATAISTLANHADALVKLVESVEQEADVLRSFAARIGAAYPSTAAAIQRVLEALEAVHAVNHR